MPRIECVLFDCDGTLVDSERLCCEAYVLMFAHFGITVSYDEMFKKYKGVKLYEIIDIINRQHGLEKSKEEMEVVFREHVARLFDEKLEPIEGAKALLSAITVPMCVVSNGPVKKMQHSLGLTGLLPFMEGRLYSGYDLQRWKPDPALLYHAAQEMQVPIASCILVEDSVAGVQAGIAANIPVYYYCADIHNPAIDHPLVTAFTDMHQLAAIWREKGYNIVEQDAVI
ncbi:6-phosphogluconate phosphatase [Rouxiella badensis]|uniref:6-phosphogluconate phosphatase n=1 Tax=Rouxiella badensis TaxID=1646377 RepID=UPI001B50CB3A|nr:6-phosphogluconate phosphatase [Rouxiella badensis]MCC3748434.1 6-phosphogluconate phosphatase [Rouxiella badensis]